MTYRRSGKREWSHNSRDRSISPTPEDAGIECRAIDHYKIVRSGGSPPVVAAFA